MNTKIIHLLINEAKAGSICFNRSIGYIHHIQIDNQHLKYKKEYQDALIHMAIQDINNHKINEFIKLNNLSAREGPRN